ncbi:MAG TPA: bifunctional UDP-3-O-[3-hydroxymyristoyl] N-acetylglucosamine deacetylase/3-hydroxyacyl-ACP dehydratase [Candidatus Hydrogenedentes bacterium]|nr:bifunctional UDP-3-O-[3-hydroxymyristoyl] N-acetylglucosamine deacetylase/3-hydroxyacyl-ACP dehydratase [Candidatus Hydrogenedentota bacterium]
MSKQRTIANKVSFSGVGLHQGTLTTVTFLPAPENSGIVFRRVDLPGSPPIPADIDHVVDVSRGTTIGIGNAHVHTVEHALSAMVGLGVDNLIVELDGDEIPNGDGSALPVMTTLLKAGIVELDAEKQYITVDRPVYYRQDDVTLSVLPSDELRVTMTIAYDHVAIGTQYASFTINETTFREQIAPARTFCFLREVKMLQEQGLIKGGSLESAVVIGDESILNEDLRFPDEFVRHKILDLLGDMYLLGRPVRGHIVGVKAGHEKNVLFSRQIRKAYLNGNGAARRLKDYRVTRRQESALDVNKIMRILPHRYPFLLVDRVLSFEPFKHVTGIKNVTVNEPFFQGHWPDIPVMPGVLIIEAMAQVSSVLIFGEDGEPHGKLAFFMGIDSAKFRRTVVPGDQLLIEAEMLHFRHNACKARARAYVDNDLCAEAIMSFSLMDIQD